MLGFLKTLGAPKDTSSKGRKKKKRYTRFKTKKRAPKIDENATHTRFEIAQTRVRADVERPNVAQLAPTMTQAPTRQPAPTRATPTRTVTPQTTALPTTAPRVAKDAVPKRDTPKPVAEPVAARVPAPIVEPVVEPVAKPAPDPIIEQIAEPSTEGVTTPTAAEAFFHQDPSPKRANAAATAAHSISPDVLRRALPKRFEDLDPDQPAG